MADSDSNGTPVSTEKSPKPSPVDGSTTDPAKPRKHIRLLSNARRKTSGISNIAFAEEMETIGERKASIRPITEYGYLKHVQSLKPSYESNDKPLSKKVRKFNKTQLDLITSLEDVLVPKTAEEASAQQAAQEKEERLSKRMTYITLVINIILVIIKIIAAVVSKSLSVISSVVDSVVDLMTNAILIWTARKIQKQDRVSYPGGRRRLEPIAIVILSVIMCAASVEVIFESGQTLSQDVEYFSNRGNNASTNKLPDIDMSTLPIVAMVLTIASKAILLVICARIDNPSMHALAEDNRNDVASNIVALVCGLVASNALKGKIKQEAIVLDPVGAILISIYIIIAWILQANRQVRRLSGRSAEVSFLQKLTHFVYNYSPQEVQKIDHVQAIYFGTNFLVEVDIGLPATMPLEEAHNIGQELQGQLEKMDDVDRAYVHLDFEYEHKQDTEHKVL